MLVAFRMIICFVLVLLANAHAAETPLPGLLVVNLTVKDPAKFAAYAAKSQPIVAAHGGKLQLRAINPEVLFGKQPYKMLVLFKFPTQDALRTFHHSEAYQKLIPTRTAGADVVFTGYDL